MADYRTITTKLKKGSVKYYIDNAGKTFQADYLDKKNKITERYIYGASGKVIEKDFYNSKGLITEKDYFNDNGLLTQKHYLNDKGIATQKQFFNNKGKIIEKDLYNSKGLITEKDYFNDNGLLTQKHYYNNEGVLSQKAFFNDKGKITEKDFLNEKGLVTEKDYFDSKGKVTAKEYFSDQGVLTSKDYFDSKGNFVRKEVPSLLPAGAEITTDGDGHKVLAYGQSAYWKNYLDYAQGDNSKGYLGCCGLVSCENVLIEAGVLAKKTNYKPVWGSLTDSIESTVVNYAASKGLCITEKQTANKYMQGGTYGSWQKSILNAFGVTASDVYTTVEYLANAVKNNKCAIVEVDADRLWNTSVKADYANHAVTVTGVAYDINNSSLIHGFYICDSGRWKTSDASRFVSYDLMKSIFELNKYTYNGKVYSVGEAIITENSVKQVQNVTSVSNSFSSQVTNSQINLMIQQMAGYSDNSDAMFAVSTENFVQNGGISALVQNCCIS